MKESQTKPDKKLEIAYVAKDFPCFPVHSNAWKDLRGKLGAEVEWIGNYAKAEKILLKKKFDAIVLDPKRFEMGSKNPGEKFKTTYNLSYKYKMGLGSQRWGRLVIPRIIRNKGLESPNLNTLVVYYSDGKFDKNEDYPEYSSEVILGLGANVVAFKGSDKPLYEIIQENLNL